MPTARPQLLLRDEDGAALPTLLWRFPEPVLSVSSAAAGGGLTRVRWVINAQVSHDYRRTDLDEHIAQIAAATHLAGPGVGLLTAVDVRRHHSVTVDDVTVTATVGVTDPVWAADLSATSAAQAPAVGTINVVAALPTRILPGGLINLVATITEAKCQALADRKVAGTGTPSDAVTVVCPADGVADRFGGPRSECGRAAAAAAYRAIIAGLDQPGG